ncbi:MULTISPECIES: fasciclin domain-containing protein [unclassified Chitinophaga]|uniref:fasciclin domain-containing protein n=1 Tax=unclassified Chitinophaga TaxID=2619133 RepID=UPI00300FA4C5
MFKKIRNAALVIISLQWSGCSKEPVNKEVNTSKQTCVEYIAADPELSCFNAALNRIDLGADTSYLQKGPFSFFAPTDAAFTRVGMTVEAIRHFDKDALRKIIYGQILTGRLGSATVAGFYKLSARCLDSTFKPILARNYYGLFLNGTGAIQSTDLGDGVVHKMENVVFPGTATLWETIKGNKNLTMLAAAIERTAPPPGQTSPQLNYKQLLESGIPEGAWMTSTVLCPTDAAFHTLGYNGLEDIQQMRIEDIRSLMRAHIFRDYLFTPDYFMNGMLQPGSAVLQVGHNVIYPKIVQANIKASNGVAHLIDQVILP